MRGLWLEEGQVRLREDVPLPEPGPGEARVRVHLAGVCATDLEMVRGYYPFSGVMGHEFVGEVTAASEPGWKGRRVVGEINAACGECPSCRNLRPTHCEQRRVLGLKQVNGVFAEYVAVPLASLHPVPDELPDELAVFTEPLAAALEILEQVHLHPSDRVLLVGAGRLGQLIARVLALTGCDLAVAARHPRQQALLQERGIPIQPADQIPARSFDVVVDATGSPGGFDLARAAVRPRGVLVLKSTYAGAMPVDLSSLVVDEVTVVGSRCGPFPPALRLLAKGLVDPRPLIEARYPLARGLEALEQAAQPGTLKVLVEG